MRKVTRIRRWIENLLLLAGVTAIAVGIGGYLLPYVSEDWGNWVFDQQRSGREASIPQYLGERAHDAERAIEGLVRHEPAPAINPAPQAEPMPAPPPPPSSEAPPRVLAKNTLIGRMRIPRLRLSTIVREGTAEDTLSIAAGHIPSTALPGDAGNIGVAGHRDTLFRGLRNIKKDDVIEFETLDRAYKYRVEGTQIVKPTEVSVLKPGREPELTLVTCYPFYYVGSAPDRFIVKAVQVGAESQPTQLAHIVTDTKAAEPQAGKADAPESEREQPRTSTVAIPIRHSRDLAPGISMGITSADKHSQRVTGWMWVMPDRRTVWVRNQPIHKPVVFYRDGKRQEMIITGITNNSVTARLMPE